MTPATSSASDQATAAAMMASPGGRKRLAAVLADGGIRVGLPQVCGESHGKKAPLGSAMSTLKQWSIDSPAG